MKFYTFWRPCNSSCCRLFSAKNLWQAKCLYAGECYWKLDVIYTKVPHSIVNSFPLLQFCNHALNGQVVDESDQVPVVVHLIVAQVTGFPLTIEPSDAPY